MLTELRQAVKALRRQPGFTAAAVLTFALGIGANTAIFALLHAALLRPLPVAEPDRLVMIEERRISSNDALLPVSGHEYVAWKERSQGFSHMALIGPASLTLTGQGEPTLLPVLRVSGDFFPLLGVAPLMGRSFADPGERASPEPVVVLSERIWRQRFASNPAVLGQTVTLDDRAYIVIGVMPRLPEALSPALWLPLDVPAEARAVGRHNLQTIGRLKAGVTRSQAQDELGRIALQLEQELPDFNTDHRASLIGLRTRLVGGVGMPLVLMLVAVGFVLLIGCVNVANLLLARTVRRQREMAVRAALGASRRRLVGQLMIECGLIAAGAGGLGLLLATWTLDVVPRMAAVDLPFADFARLDGPVLLMALALTVATALLTAVLPAWRTATPVWAQWLAQGARASEDRRGRRLRSTLVAAEVALALTLLVGAGLMVNSFVRLIRVPPGFATHGVMVLGVDLPGVRYPTPEQRRDFFDGLLARLRALPGVVAAGATSNLPLGGSDNWMPFSIEGRPPRQPGDQLYAPFRVATDDYFRTLQIPLREGRFFGDEDARQSVPVVRWFAQAPMAPRADEPQAAPVVIISEAAARRYWPGENPIGQRIRVLFSPELTVVGVVGDVKHNGLNVETYPHFYLRHGQEPWSSMSVVVRSSIPPEAQSGPVREAVRGLDPALPLTLRTMDDVFSDSVGQQRFYAVLVGLFGTVALGLAVIGVFGVVSYTTAQRTREIGVRVALGARRREVLRLVLGQGMLPVLVGVAVGTAGALAASRFLDRLLYEITPVDPPTYVAVSLLMTTVALAACWIPARRALRVNPVEALRQE